jgi:ABC-type uncharacterized transport system substrate-binding protein
MTYLMDELVAKQLNLLLDLVPQATTIAYLSLAGTPVSEETKSNALAAGRALGRKVIVSEVRGLDFEAAFTTLVEQRAGAVVVGNFTFFLRNRFKIIELAARHKIAAIYPLRPYVIGGGLMCYAPAEAGSHPIALNYIVPILKGAKPADLPVQQPTKFEFVINLKTVKAMGLTIPRTLFATATEFIE